MADSDLRALVEKWKAGAKDLHSDAQGMEDGDAWADAMLRAIQLQACADELAALLAQQAPTSEREIIADYIASCREDDTDSPRVQVFDVLASQIRRGEHLVQQARPAPSPSDERIYPCVKCGTMRSKAEGGTTFTVCDECWDKAHPTT